jgi:hypothetical protein
MLPQADLLRKTVDSRMHTVDHPDNDKSNSLSSSMLTRQRTQERFQPWDSTQRKVTVPNHLGNSNVQTPIWRRAEPNR